MPYYSDFTMGSNDGFELESSLHPCLELLQAKELETRLKGLETAASKNVLESIPMDQMESLLLKPSLSLVLQASKRSFHFIEGLERKSAEIIQKKINSVASLLEQTEIILSHLGIVATGKNIRSLESLISTFPSILKGYMAHCRRSSEIYESSEVLTSLQAALNKLFHQIRENLIAYARLLETTLNFDESTKYLSAVLNDCVEYHDHLREMDYKTLGITWKLFARLCKSYSPDLIKESYDFSLPLNTLSDYALQSILRLKDVVAPGDKRGGIRESQMASFILKIVRQLLELYPESISDYTAVTGVIGLILLMPLRFPEANWPSGAKEKIQHEIPSLNALILQDLLRHPKFPSFILSPPPHDLNKKEERLMTLLFLMEHVNKESNETLWNSETKKSLLQLLFDLLESFSPALNAKSFLLGVQFEGRPLCPVFTYEALASRLQGFIAGLRPQDFPFAERIILKTLFREDFWCSVLAGDCLCFMARFGTSELCYAHFRLLVKAQEGGNFPVLEDTLRRLFSFLSDEDIKTFSREYPFKPHLSLWSLLVSPQKKFPELSKFCVSVLRESLEGHRPKASLEDCLKIISMSEVDSVDLLISLWETIASSCNLREVSIEYSFQNIFEWTLFLLPKLGGDKTRVFKCIEGVIQSFPSSRIPTAHFLTRIPRETHERHSTTILDHLLNVSSSEFIVSQRAAHVIKNLIDRRLLSSGRFSSNIEMKEQPPAFDEYSYFALPIYKGGHPSMSSNALTSKKRKWEDDKSSELRKRSEDVLLDKVVKIIESAIQSINSELSSNNSNPSARSRVETLLNSLSDISASLSKSN